MAGSGLTFKSVIEDLRETRVEHLRDQHKNLRTKKAISDSACDYFKAGYSQAVHDLKEMGVIDVSEEPEGASAR